MIGIFYEPNAHGPNGPCEDSVKSMASYDCLSLNWGPGKVGHNLRKGLEELGVEYKINEKQEYNILLHGGVSIDKFIGQEPDPEKSLIGPCAESFLGDHTYLHENFKNYIAASPWHKKLYEEHSLERSKDKNVFYWPCGIDTDFYKPFPRAEKYNDYVHYDKHTLADFHYWIRALVDSFGQKMSYSLGTSNYENIGLKAYCDSSKYCVSTCGSETQGLGNMEVLSMNLPIFGLDKNYHFAFGMVNSRAKSTSFPYFSEECGIILHMKDYVIDFERIIENMNPPCAEHDCGIDYTNIKEYLNVEYIREKFSMFLENVNGGSYSPREYILENHTLKKGAQNLIDVFENLKKEEEVWYVPDTTSKDPLDLFKKL